MTRTKQSSCKKKTKKNATTNILMKTLPGKVAGPSQQRINQYTGWDPHHDRLAKRARLDATPSGGDGMPSTSTRTLVGEGFWKDYVSNRRPVILKGEAKTVCPSTDICNLDFLCDKAGEAIVQVERQVQGEGFGKGKRESMLFSDFIKALQQGDETLYLTTQEAKIQDNALPEILTSPALELRELFDPQPAMMGNLVPQSVNLWIGSSTSGVSSGLHHDFHDNLYVLLRGQKTFRLWSPRHAGEMATHGTLQRVYPNGRIVYEGQGDVLADGSLNGDQGRHLSQPASRELANGSDGQPEDLNGALDSESELEAALNLEISGRKRHRFGVEFVQDDFDDFDEVDCSASDSESSEPPSFSRIDLSKGASAVSAEFPQFPGMDSSLRCDLEAGDMLYLPAGWFHDVTSSNGSNNGDGDDKGWHMALNYWFHPPDNLECTKAGFRSPYTTPFWHLLHSFCTS